MKKTSEQANNGGLETRSEAALLDALRNYLEKVQATPCGISPELFEEARILVAEREAHKSRVSSDHEDHHLKGQKEKLVTPPRGAADQGPRSPSARSGDSEPSQRGGTGRTAPLASGSGSARQHQLPKEHQAYTADVHVHVPPGTSASIPIRGGGPASATTFVEQAISSSASSRELGGRAEAGPRQGSRGSPKHQKRSPGGTLESQQVEQVVRKLNIANPAVYARTLPDLLKILSQILLQWARLHPRENPQGLRDVLTVLQNWAEYFDRAEASNSNTYASSPLGPSSVQRLDEASEHHDPRHDYSYKYIPSERSVSTAPPPPQKLPAGSSSCGRVFPPEVSSSSSADAISGVAAASAMAPPGLGSDLVALQPKLRDRGAKGAGRAGVRGKDQHYPQGGTITSTTGPSPQHTSPATAAYRPQQPPLDQHHHLPRDVEGGGFAADGSISSTEMLQTRARELYARAVAAPMDDNVNAKIRDFLYRIWNEVRGLRLDYDKIGVFSQRDRAKGWVHSVQWLEFVYASEIDALSGHNDSVLTNMFKNALYRKESAIMNQMLHQQQREMRGEGDQNRVHGGKQVLEFHDFIELLGNLAVQIAERNGGTSIAEMNRFQEGTKTFAIFRLAEVLSWPNYDASRRLRRGLKFRRR
eukprot:CAMPEP_0178981618 /NCGR_PEP_ID=MMETSP0795-20121207/40_1 /TAXON_ID=88552 /ORGANISM="Amoebophrya sp., Strain Ameob2" /LENGTH=644 /DNA_ID=CAMNT_0020672171 /DNA_START=673 /DNA_END=2606 /DNA_ORIENTATION=+